MTLQHRSVIINSTQVWLEKAVIGLNLCPFAKAVHVRKQIRYVVSDATCEQGLHSDLLRELRCLRDADPNEIDTTLLIHPNVLTDFLDFNDFLDVADTLLEEVDLNGILQIASFHPNYQFAGTKPDDLENYTNRSPYPTLHILREESVTRAVDAFSDTDEIFHKNRETLHKLGITGWQKLFFTK
ncbi:MAG: hypothetical protein K0R08_30 [Solimicrobium sp.]|jgi:hypothetical protein|nr:hypothetical protein [Solimicrobium sp.]